ncbi:MAG: hypothetical protein AB7U61_11970 [Methylocystis sp.]
MTKPQRPKQQGPQTDKFVEAARELGCDESEAHFDAALKKVAQHKSGLAKKDKKQHQGGGKSGTKT